MCNWKCTPQAKFLVKFVWKLLGIPFFLICGVCDQRRDRGTQFFGGVDITQKGEVHTFGFAERPSNSFLNGTSWFPHKENSEEVARFAYCNDFRRVSESIFFQSNKFIAYKVKDEKEVANSLMAFNLLKIIHPFQGKKHIRTY